MTIHAGGEEWAGLRAAAGMYDPADHVNSLRQARENIERFRKRDVCVRLLDRAGRPLGGQSFEIVQKTHDFPFGDCLWSLDRWLHAGMREHDRVRVYTDLYRACLNAATALCYWTERPRCDGPKTEDVQGRPRTEGFRECVDWANANGLICKGHPLFWSIPKCIPEWVKRYDYATQLKFAEVRVRSLVAGAQGRVRIWDVVNEPLWEAAFKNLSRRAWPHIETVNDMAEYIAPVLEWARSEDPDACYVLNDYGLTDDRGRSEPLIGSDGLPVTAARQRARMLELVRFLADRGAAPDAIGMQSHVGGWQTPAAQMAVYDELGAFGIPIHITEFWAHEKELDGTDLGEDDKARIVADYVGNYLTCAFGHPAVEAFFFWGFMGRALRFGDARDGVPGAGVETRPVYERVKVLINDEWRTRTTATADANGTVRFRGFFGEYAIRCAPRVGQPAAACFRAAKGQEGIQTLRMTAI